jgi:ketosteroid isomerase-like protein
MGSVENVELVRIAMDHTDEAANAAAWGTSSEDLVWHFDAEGSELAGVYRGKDYVFTNFHMKLFELTDGTFDVKAIDISAAGDELVLVHYWASMTIAGVPRSGDGALVFRVVDGAIAEVFDIPSRELLAT